MDENNIQNSLVGEPTESYEKHGSIAVVLDFFEKYLPLFTDNAESKEIKTEKGLVSHLLDIIEVYLFSDNNDIKQNYPFRFRNEYLVNKKQGNSPSVDIGVLSINENHTIETITYGTQTAFFAIEAKILGLSSQQKPKLRNKEYIIGHIEKEDQYKECGGIERFKTGKHGSKIYEAGMIGFVLKGTFESWFIKINNWIGEFAKGEQFPVGCRCRNWSESEKLVEQKLAIPNPRIRKYFSVHSRKVIVANMPNKLPISHFWVNLISS